MFERVCPIRQGQATQVHRASQRILTRKCGPSNRWGLSRSPSTFLRALRPAALILLSIFAWACQRTYHCDEDGRCDCHGQRDCVISCPYDRCDVSCSHTSQSCGVVCGDHCDFDCHDSNHCSSFSRDKSEITCHNLPSCASECGEECVFDCRDVSECFARAGDRSKLSCDHVARCELECEGECEVSCSDVSRCHVSCDGPCEVELTCNSVADCRLTCEGGQAQRDLGSGTYRCGEK